MPKTLRALLARLDEQGTTDHRRYEEVRRYLNFKARDKGVPISGSFELTPLCNLDCKMCYVHLNKEQMKGAQLLTTEQWKDIMQQAIDAGMMYATLTGGECLTHPGFKELYLFLREYGVEISILSNGLLMDEEMVEFLNRNTPSMIQVSLYGASEDAYERVTGKRVFRDIVQNITRIKEAGLPLVIAVTPSSYMMDGEEILRFLKDHEFSYQISSGLIAPRKETERDLADAGLETYVKLFRLLKEQNGILPEPECDIELLPEPGGNCDDSLIGVHCSAGRGSFAVDWRGGLLPCNAFPCKAENVIELGFDEAWKRINSIANAFPLPKECEGCSYRSECRNCVAEHASGAEIGHASRRICDWTKRMKAEGLL